MVQTSEVEHYKNYGRCLKLENGEVELLITLEIGPRIISYRRREGENVFFEDVGRLVQNGGEAFDRYYYKGAVWYLYGGHRLWVTPESMPETYYPDNEPVRYEVSENEVTFTPPPQKQNGIACQLVVRLEQNGTKVELEHRVKNIGAVARTFSVWSLNVMAQNGVELVPQPNSATGLLANRRLVLWDYTDMDDGRVHWGRDYIVLKQDPKAERAFKFGINNEHGCACYFTGDTAFVLRYCHDRSAQYPDYGVSYETYTSDQFLEMETLTEEREVAPGETAVSRESWQLFACSGKPEVEDSTTFAPFAKFLSK